jgi:hypothetical protein
VIRGKHARSATRYPRMGRTTRRTRAVVVLLAAWSLATAVASAAPRPLHLRVAGGEETWHSQRLFSLSWSNPAGVAAVHYRLLDPVGGVLIGDTRLPWPATALANLSVPPRPGAYTAEIWLEDGSGGLGESEAATLRFDDARPAGVTALAPPGWLGRSSFPYLLRVSHPAGPQPLSGIAGYAVKIDASASGHPCPSGRCGESDLDARGGVGADTIEISDLPEGLNHVHAVAVSGSGMASASPGETLLRVDESDPRTVLEGTSEGWSDTPVRLTARATDTASGMSPTASGTQPFTAIRVDGGTPIVAAGDSVSATVIGSGVHTIAYYARDAAGNANDGGVSDHHANHSPATALVRIDREPPAVAFVAAQDPADPERIEARAADSAAGVDPAHGSISVRRAGASQRYERLPTEIVGGALRARWDSSAVAAGDYEFRVTAYDRAGNLGISTFRAGGRTMRLRAPLKQPVRLLTKTGRRLVRYGRGAWYSGRLLTGRRTPLAGTPVRVTERFAAGGMPAERVTTVRSGGDGRFGLRLAPGPSRWVSAEVSPTPAHGGASSEPLVIAVNSRLALRASSAVARVGGAPVVFRGRIARDGASLPVDGKVLQLQFRLPGMPWSEFRTVRSDRSGRFRYAYSFSDDDSRGVRFQFRAYAPAQAGWPFEPAGSAPVMVRGV